MEGHGLVKFKYDIRILVEANDRFSIEERILVYSRAHNNLSLGCSAHKWLASQLILMSCFAIFAITLCQYYRKTYRPFEFKWP